MVASWLQRLMDRGIVSTDIYHKAFHFFYLGLKLTRDKKLFTNRRFQIKEPRDPLIIISWIFNTYIFEDTYVVGNGLCSDIIGRKKKSWIDNILI